MAFKDIAKGIKYPDGTSERFKRLDAYDRLREGTLYDHIKTPFDEGDDEGDYVKMRNRRPNVIWDGAKMLADQISGLLWGDEQMPIVRTYEGDEPTDEEKNAEQGIQHIAETLSLDAVMDGITAMASSGSCAVVFRATDDKELWLETIPGKEIIPTFDPRNPKKLLSIEQKYPTTGQALKELGYDIADEDLRKDYWFRLTIDKREEVRYKPLKVDDYKLLGQLDPLTRKKRTWERDEENSFEHGWGVVPVIWCKAPSPSLTKIDGDCLYGKIVDILVSIDYNLSQVQRGLRYTADPMIAYRKGEIGKGSRESGYDIENAGENKPLGDDGVKAPNRIFNVEAGGDAKMLEISGEGLSKFQELIKLLREYGLEVAGGMKSDAENTKGVESGRALEILFQTLILVVKRWRTALGNNGYIPILRMILLGITKGLIVIDGLKSEIPAGIVMRLVWPSWMTPTGADLLATANAYQSLAGGSAKAPVPVLPRAIVTRVAATNLGMNDVNAILEALEEQQQEDEAQAQQEAQQSHENAKELIAAKSAADSKKTDLNRAA